MESNSQSSSQQSPEGALSGAAESLSAAADKVHETVRQTQEKLNQIQRDVRDKTRYAAQSTDTYVREQPWNAVCAAVGIGFVLGLIVGRR